MELSDFISLFGGISLFLFGMTLMGEGLKKVAGTNLEVILYKLSDTPLKGMLLGAGVTAVIQSSSATSVMVVGFVNSGMMKLNQAISIVIGAIIGTSVTGWIVCLSAIEGNGWMTVFSSSTLGAFVAAVGIIFRMFCKTQREKHVGDIMLGFAVLMYGMNAMSEAVIPLRTDPSFIKMLVTFSNPLIGIAAGIIFTAVLQSASAAVGILQALSTTGVLTFSTLFPVVLGISIGAAVPVLFSALGAKADGKRAAFAYLFVNLLGVILCGGIFYAANCFADFKINTIIMDPFSIAAVNMIYRIVAGIIILPLVNIIARLLTCFLKESESEKAANEDFDRLDDRFLTHPAIAVEQSRLTVVSMAERSLKNITDAISLLFSYNEKKFEDVVEAEELIDRYEDRIGTYLLRINCNELEKSQNERVSEFLHTLTDFERISDHALNIAESAKEIFEKKISFSVEAGRELDVLVSAVSDILEKAFSAFISGDDKEQYKIEPIEELIDNLTAEMKLRHIERMQKGICSMSQGFVFNDILSDLERVADHCSNIAIAMIELSGDEYDPHNYIENLRRLHSHNFDELYAEYSAKYKI